LSIISWAPFLSNEYSEDSRQLQKNVLNMFKVGS
jgi:hypothetical protein